uniref:Uncharacterized protein n=1 Tax=Anguilla anguilla TaxID=7936 RepID=A0A0E9V7N0_ANGAN
MMGPSRGTPPPFTVRNCAVPFRYHIPP